MRMRWLAGLATTVALGAAGTAHAQGELPASEALSTNVQSVVNFNWLDMPYLVTASSNGWRDARSDAFWFNVEATKGTYDWTSLDRIKSAMDGAGIRWAPILHGSPSWARDSGGSNLLPPAERAYPDFARFAAAFAARYGPNGPMGGSWPVVDVEIGNEMDVLWPRGAESYAELYAQTRGAIKAANGNVRVVVGAVLYDTTPPVTDADWIRNFFTALGGRGADAIAIHPYAPTVIGVVANLRRMQQAIANAGQGDLPLYVNEVGYPAALDGATPKLQAAQGPTSDEARAGTTTLLTDALLASDCNVRNIGYFDLVGPESNRADTDYLSSETWKGLIRRPNSALTLTGAAYRDAARRWEASPQPGTVHACGPTAGPNTKPLLLELKIERPSQTCFRPTVNYRGFPIEEATVVVRTADGKTSPLLTNANGQLSRDFCVDPGDTYLLQAQVVYAPANVPVFAQSVTYSCAPRTAVCQVFSGADVTLQDGVGVVGPAPKSGTVSGQSLCLVSGMKVYGSTKLATVLKRGLKLRSTPCKATSDTAATGKRKLSILLTLDRKVAKRLKITRKLSKHAVTVGSAKQTVTGSAAVTVTLKFTKTARKRLRGARKVTLRLAVAVTEGKATKTVVHKVVLKR